MSDEWIRADQIPTFLQWNDANEYGQRVQLLNCLKSGRVAVKADDGETGRIITNDRGQLEKNHENWRDWRDIPTTVWRDHPYDLNMSARTYSYALKPSRGTKEGDWLTVKLTGLSFSKSDIRRELAPEQIVAQTSEPKNKGGSPVNAEKWSNFSALLAAYAQSGGDIVPGEQAGALYAKVMDFGATLGLESKDLPGLDTSKKALNKAMAFVQTAENPASGD